jgi:predicted phage terminase large subunit-like protein
MISLLVSLLALSMIGMVAITPKVRLPEPMPHQVNVLEAPYRFKILVTGRRWGKTMLGLIACLSGHGNNSRHFPGALQGGEIAWLAPTYGIAQNIWRDLKYACDDAIRAGAADKKEDEHFISFDDLGSVVVKSVDDPDMIRGFGWNGAVLDEAAYMKKKVWTEVVRPALSDKGGWAIIISTPTMEEKQGENWFKDVYNNAADQEDWARWQRPSSDNPLMTPKELAAARKEIGELSYRQEYEAEFLNLGYGVFKREWFLQYKQDDNFYYLIKRDTRVEAVAKRSCKIFCTVDLAFKLKQISDYTVVSVWALTPNRDLLLLDVIRGRFESSHHPKLIYEAHKKYNPEYIGIERGGSNSTLADNLRAGNFIIQDGLMTVRIPKLRVRDLEPDKDKLQRAVVAAQHYENGHIFHPWYLNDATKPKWLSDYEYELVDFPMGQHDDQVDTASYAAVEISRPYYGDASKFPILAAGAGVAAHTFNPLLTKAFGKKVDADDPLAKYRL